MVVETKKQDAALTWAEIMPSIKFEDIPTEVAAITKRDILDILGTTTAGSKVQAARDVVELMKEWGGKEESTVVAHGCRLPSPNAAMANGAMAHALDYDDIYDAPGVHIGIGVVPAAFAAAERRGNVSGKEFITAVTMGLELICRIGDALKTGKENWSDQVYGYMGAAAAAGRVLGLDQEKMVSALGLAYGQASGARQFIVDRGLQRAIYAGFTAKGGLLAALMAERGLTGARDSLEGQYGFFKVYYDEYDPDVLTADLGKRFILSNLSFKAYPACRNTHAYVDAVLKIVSEHAVQPQDVEQVVVHVAGFAKHLCEPQDICQNPQFPIQAQYSIPYIVALAIAKKRVTLADFLGDDFRDPEVLELARKVVHLDDPSLVTRGIEPAIVEIKTRKGHYVERVDFPKGNPAHPMTQEDFLRKFRDCVRYAVKPMPPENVEKAIQMAASLEKVDDVSHLIRLF